MQYVHNLASGMFKLTISSMYNDLAKPLVASMLITKLLRDQTVYCSSNSTVPRILFAFFFFMTLNAFILCPLCYLGIPI